MGRASALYFTWPVACLTFVVPHIAWAVGAADAPGQAQRSLVDVERESSSISQVIVRARISARTAEQRLADGEMLLRTKDYPRAVTVLNEVIEKYPEHPTVYADGLSLLGEAYFQSNQLLSARRTFRRIVDTSSDRRMGSYVPHAFARLVDVTLRRQTPAELDEILAKMSQWAPDATISYARGKALFVKKDSAGARAAVSSVPPSHPFYAQSRYLLGVIAMRDAQASAPPVKLLSGEAPPPAPRTRYAGAIEAFRQVTRLSPDTSEHRHVIDLAWLAIARLFYEAGQWVEAADAYGHVDRASPEFGASLYELAWVYVRLGDADRASRALEVLAIADPKNTYLADGSLLRADLQLRSGKFNQALVAYQNVRAEYSPMRDRVDTFLTSTNDPSIYYDKLAQEPLDVASTNSALPPLALRWAREERDGPTAFAILDDTNLCRELIRQSEDMAQKMGVLLSASNRVRAFPDLRAGDEKMVQLLNQITRARGTIASGLDDSEPKEVSGELLRVRQERRTLQRRLPLMPVTDSDMAARDDSAQRQWNGVSQRTQQLQLEIDQLNAIVNGLNHALRDPAIASTRDPARIQQWQGELAIHEQDIKRYRNLVDTVRQSIDVGRVQVGYGDQRFIEDEQVRNAFREKLKEEVRLVAAGAAGANGRTYASRVTPVLARADIAESRLVALRRDLDAQVAKKVQEVTAIIDRESANLAVYKTRLAGLDQEARVVVGQVALRNFGLVRDRFKNIVLRADVGSAEQAWEVREEQVTRVRNLQIERVREEQILKEELREVLDDAGDPASSPVP